MRPTSLRKAFFLLPLLLIFTLFLSGQGSADHSYKPLIIKLDESGAKYIRFITWHQVWAQTNNLSVEGAKLQITPMIRRSRFLFYAQVSPRFLILTHVGMNNLTPSNLTATGSDGDAPQLFVHDAWTEFKVTKNEALYLGGGLHYWNGLSRLSSAGTLNFATLDQPRPFAHWHSLGLSDQFARHLGIYAKGAIGKLDYRLALNAPGRNPLKGGQTYGSDTTFAYTGVAQPTPEGNPTGNTIAEGYVRYQFFDTESIKLPYNVGAYLGEKKVLAIGAGFFAHPNGMYDQVRGVHADVFHFSVDAFLDFPLSRGNSVQAYASYINFDYGENFVGRWAGAGDVLYGQLAVFLKPLRAMPYIAIQRAAYNDYSESKPLLGLDLGLNYFIQGHNAKLTLEYHRIARDPRETAGGDLSQLRLQAHIFL